MFCPNCGEAEQTPETYCRNCGVFLTDFSGNTSLVTRVLGANTPEKRVNVGLAFDTLTLVFSSLMLIFLFGYFDGRFTKTGEFAPPIVYFVYIFLGLTVIWQFLSLIVGISHKNKLSGGRKGAASEHSGMMKTVELKQGVKDYLPSADFENVVPPPSVIEDTTKHLDKMRPK